MGRGGQQKGHIGEEGSHQKITEDHNHDRGGGPCQKIVLTDGAHKGNNDSHDQYQWVVQEVISS